MNRRSFFASVVSVVGALKCRQPARPFPDPDVNLSVPMDWKQWELPTNPPIRCTSRPDEILIISGGTGYVFDPKPQWAVVRPDFKVREAQG